MAWRRGSRRTADYPTNMNEEYAQESPETEQEKSGKRPENAQPPKADFPGDKKSNDQDILLLLEKINLQLENMRLSEQNQQQNPKRSTQSGQNKEPGLEKLIAQLLQNSNTNQSGDKPEDNKQQTNDATNLLDQLLNAANKKQPSQSQQSKPQKSSSDTLVLETAAEVLSRAQYELSNELENSLKKLKQVISESEQIANKISNLIEQKQQ
jgi:hypothetical protein